MEIYVNVFLYVYSVWERSDTEVKAFTEPPEVAKRVQSRCIVLRWPEAVENQG